MSNQPQIENIIQGVAILRQSWLTLAFLVVLALPPWLQNLRSYAQYYQ